MIIQSPRLEQIFLPGFTIPLGKDRARVRFWAYSRYWKRRIDFRRRKRKAVAVRLVVR